MLLGDGQHATATCIVDPDPAVRNTAVPRSVARVRESMHSRPGRSRLPTHIFTSTQEVKMALTRRQKLILWWWWKKRNILHPTRRFAVHPINKLRHIHGEYHHLMPPLLNDPERFVQYFRMKHQTFYDLLQHCAADLKEKSTNFCRAVSPEERLVVTLRYCFEKQRKFCICGSVVCVCNSWRESLCYLNWN